MKLLIKKSPVGALKLGYSIGEVVEVKDEKQINALLKGDFAIPYSAVKKAAEKDSDKGDEGSPEVPPAQDPAPTKPASKPANK